MNLEQVNDKLFCKVYQANSISIVTILDRKENGIPFGAPDVKVRSVAGGSQMINRKELIASYKSIKGKKLNMMYIKNNTGYCVIGGEHAYMYALKIPKGAEMQYGNKVARAGSWLICRDDGMGGINKQSATCMSNEQFRKMFKIMNIGFVEDFRNYGNKPKAEAVVENGYEIDFTGAYEDVATTAEWEVIAINEEQAEERYRISNQKGETKLISAKTLKALIQQDKVEGLSYNEGANAYIGWNSLNQLPRE